VRPLRDADDRIGFYVLAGGILPGWSGAQVQVSWDGGLTFASVAEVPVGATLGYLTIALNDAPPETVDYYSVATVHIYRDELDSVTFAQLINEANGIVIGDEVMQFQTATLVDTDTYELTTLTRGRLGTDAVEHAIGERFALLSGAVFIEVDRANVGRDVTVRGVSYGTPADSAPTDTYTFACNAQLEYAPVMFIGARDGSNNVTVTWSGAGRIGANTTATHGVYFSHYEVTFTTPGSSNSVSKTTTDQTYAYTAAEQTIDFGSVPASLSVSIVQVNTITGDGPALTGTI
jgi:hypothetical protein